MTPLATHRIVRLVALAAGASCVVAAPASAAPRVQRASLAAMQSDADARARAQELERAIQLRPRVAELYVQLAREYERAGDAPRAEATLRRGVAEAWEERSVRASLVDLLARADRWDDAVTEAQPLATDSASRVMVARLRVNAGIAAYHAGDRARARAAWERALVDDPTLTEAAVNLGAVLLELGKRDSARSVARRALASHPTDVRLLALNARTLDGPEGVTAAIRAMRQARAEHPDDENAGLQLASYLAAAGNQLPAMALYDTLVHAPAASERAFDAAVAFWLGGGQPKPAAEVAELGLKKYPRSTGLLASLGQARAMEKEWVPAVDAYRRAISLARDREPLELALLDVHLNGADTSEALVLARALAARPASRATLLRVADRIAPLPAWRADPSPADSSARPNAAAVVVADRIYDGILERDSLDLDALEGALELAESTRDSARAVALAGRALAADSSGAAPPLVLLRFARPDADSARLLLRRALWRGVDRLQALEMRTAGALGGNVDLRALARAKPELARRKRAQDRLRWALDTAVFHTSWGTAELQQLRLAYPQSALLARYAADVAAKDGRDSVALAEYERVLRRNPSDVDAQLARAELLLRAGRTDDAIDSYARAFDADPTNDSTYRALRMLRERQGTLDVLAGQLRRLRLRLPDARPLGEHEVEVLQRLGRLQEAQALAAELAKERKP